MEKKSTVVESNFIVGEFPDRLFEACGTKQVAEVARILDISYQTAKNYVEGRLPSAEVLIMIANSTNVSLNWLLTGKGRKHLGAEENNDGSVGALLKDKYSIRDNDLEVVVRAPEETSLSIDPEVVSLLGDILRRAQHSLQSPSSAEEQAVDQPKRKTSKKGKK